MAPKPPKRSVRPGGAVAALYIHPLTFGRPGGAVAALYLRSES